MSSSASWTIGKVRPYMSAAPSSAASAANLRLRSTTDGPGAASAGPAVGDRQAAVLAERLGRHPHAGGRLAPLVLVAVDEGGDTPHRLRVVARGFELGHGEVVLDVTLDDRVEQLVLGQRVGVLLVG